MAAVAASRFRTNFSFVDKARLLAGSCRPVESTLDVDAAFLVENNIKGVVSMSDLEYPSAPFTSRGIKFLRVPVGDFQPLTIQQMQLIVKFVESLGPDAAVLIHCNAGMGRTGTALSSLLVWREKATAEVAIQQVRAARPGSVETQGQVDGVRAWAEFLAQP